MPKPERAPRRRKPSSKQYPHTVGYTDQFWADAQDRYGMSNPASCIRRNDEADMYAWRQANPKITPVPDLPKPDPEPDLLPRWKALDLLPKPTDPRFTRVRNTFIDQYDSELEAVEALEQEKEEHEARNDPIKSMRGWLMNWYREWKEQE